MTYRELKDRFSNIEPQLHHVQHNTTEDMAMLMDETRQYIKALESKLAERDKTLERQKEMQTNLGVSILVQELETDISDLESELSTLKKSIEDAKYFYIHGYNINLMLSEVKYNRLSDELREGFTKVALVEVEK